MSRKSIFFVSERRETVIGTGIGEWLRGLTYDFWTSCCSHPSIYLSVYLFEYSPLGSSFQFLFLCCFLFYYFLQSTYSYTHRRLLLLLRLLPLALLLQPLPLPLPKYYLTYYVIDIMERARGNAKKASMALSTAQEEKKDVFSVILCCVPFALCLT
ncbi:hypothetical protein F4777DRAFT_167059 [Nemania sp. FL0916]|nr:hypothetical protein F4777DRAFT_167059 [Nemania sp. FL0916]